MQCKDIPDVPILHFLAKQSRWSTHGEGYSMPTVQNAMPSGTPVKLQVAKMKMLVRRKLVNGCGCGCRGDWEITEKGLEYLDRIRQNHLRGVFCKDNKLCSLSDFLRSLGEGREDSDRGERFVVFWNIVVS